MGDCRCPEHCTHTERPCWYCAALPEGATVDRYYCEKVAKGLIGPLALGEKEMAWTMVGRLHGDGRRSDQYVPRGVKEDEYVDAILSTARSWDEAEERLQALDLLTSSPSTGKQ